MTWPPSLGAVATVVAGPDTGAKALIDFENGYVAGSLPPEIAEDVRADAVALMDNEQNRTLEYGERAVFIETVAPDPHLLVFGAVHIAQPLTTMARQLGYTSTIVDARAAFTTAERFPDADRVLVGSEVDHLARRECIDAQVEVHDERILGGGRIRLDAVRHRHGDGGPRQR